MGNMVFAHRRSPRPSIDRHALRPAAEVIEPRRLLSAFTVNTTSDVTNPSDGLTTLREAIVAANAHGGADTINFSPAVFTSGTLHTIRLTAGQLSITDTSGTTTISGPGSSVLAVDAQQKSRVFQINANVTAAISGLTITGGLITAPTGATPANGGGIFTAGHLSLSHVVVDANEVVVPFDFTTAATAAAASGGGIYSSGTLSITSSTISGNEAVGGSTSLYPNGAAKGGGIYSAGALDLATSTIINNIAAGGVPQANTGQHGGDAFGGGIYCSASLTVTQSSLTNNIALAGTSAFPNSTVGGNAKGGAIFALANCSLSDSTLTGNSATGGDSGYAGTSTVDSDPNTLDSASGGGAYCAGNTLSVLRCTFSNNRAVAGNGASGESGPGGNAAGGALVTLANTSLASTTISGNLAQSGDGDIPPTTVYGGGIDARASLTITACTITGNTALGGTGGYYNGVGAAALGGGVHAAGTLLVTASAISGNHTIGGRGGEGGLFVQGGAGPGGLGAGGGIYSDAGATITGTTIANNDATGGAGGQGLGFQNAADNGGDGAGGAVYGLDPLSIAASTLSGNTASGGKGGTANSYSEPDSSRVAGLGGNGSGGAVFADGDPTIVNATLANNIAVGGDGGDLRHTFAGQANSGGNGFGGAVDGGHAFTLANSTVSGNRAAGGNAGYTPPGAVDPIIAKAGHGSGGGLWINNGAPVLTNSIVSANTRDGAAFDDVRGSLNKTSSKFNLIGVGGGLTNGVNGNKVSVNNPQLQALGNYGGPTQTMRPIWPSSPAIDAGSNALIPAGVTTDQRGQPRIAGARVDIGAVELGAPSGGGGNTGTISGTVFNDANANGVRDGGEGPLKDWTLFLDVNHDGKFESGEPTAISDANGNYAFHNLAGGSYTLREVGQTGWRLDAPADQFYNLTIKSGGSATGRLFANTQKAFISGTVFNDANGNKSKDAGETGLSAWRLYIDANNNGKFDSGETSVLSDASGNWQFGNLSPGTYVVRVVLQSGWSLTTPSSGSFSFSVGFGSSRVGNLFGVKRI